MGDRKPVKWLQYKQCTVDWARVHTVRNVASFYGHNNLSARQSSYYCFNIVLSYINNNKSFSNETVNQFVLIRYLAQSPSTTAPKVDKALPSDISELRPDFSP